jgi:hypothetical protein
VHQKQRQQLRRPWRHCRSKRSRGVYRNCHGTCVRACVYIVEAPRTQVICLGANGGKV